MPASTAFFDYEYISLHQAYYASIFMYLIAIAWIYVVLMMSVAEATNTTGTLLGALITFVLYGLLPLSLVFYIMRTPARKRANKAKEKVAAINTQETFDHTIDGDTDSSNPPDTSGHAASAPTATRVTAVRKEL